MLNFKDQIIADSKQIFHNEKEFADKKDFYYDGDKVTAPLILDVGRHHQRQLSTAYERRNDNSEGIFERTATLYIHQNDIDFIPRQGKRIEIDDIFYYIDEVIFECGEIIMKLRRIDE